MALPKNAFFIPLMTVLILGSSADRASADITWNFFYQDVINSTGVGFDDAILGGTRQTTFEATLDYVNSVLDEPSTVDLNIASSQVDASGFLASAGPLLFTGPNGFANGFVFDHATTGIDPYGSVPDGEVTFDFGYNWNSDLDTPTGSEFDMFTVSLHEVTHAMGFTSFLNENGTGLNGTNPDRFSAFDRFLERGDGTGLFDLGGLFLGDSSDLTSNDVFFRGPAATAANGGNPVQIYAPESYAEGSSLAHVMATTTMNFAIAPGVTRRSYSAQEIGILQDTGYTTAIPELSPAFPLFALFFLGGVLHRKLS